MIILLCLLPSGTGCSMQRDSLFLVFWNLENFFDWKDDGTGDSEREFSAEGMRHWTKNRFYSKCNAIAKTILLLADTYGRIPDAVGFSEVENSFVLHQLVRNTVLAKLGYRIIHYESPDSRGIDCALIYRHETLDILSSEPKHIYDSSGTVLHTRDILLVQFGAISILVNHHPSKLGGKSDRRNLAMSRMKSICDSLGAVLPCICIGDFNDDVWGKKSPGTIKYNGAWEKIDGCFHNGFDSVREEVFDHPYLMEQDKSFGGMKPRRTYSGPRYLGGISDHLPVSFMLYFQPTN